MRFSIFERMSSPAIACVLVLFALVSVTAFGQRSDVPGDKPASQVKVTQIDGEQFRKLIKPRDKPLLINFWATWCDPCREEFPDLVKFDNEFKGKIDFLTISLDEPEDITTTVPKFLASMKAEMPAYLLKVPDEGEIITSISKDWHGGMPFTALFAPDGSLAYFREGKIVTETLRTEVNKVLSSPPSAEDLFVVADFVKIKTSRRDEAIYFYENNWKLYREEAKRRGVIDSFEIIEARSEKSSAFDLILITRYRGEDQLKNSEANFEPILKQLRPNGPALKNQVRPDEFRENVFAYTGKVMFFSR